MEMCKILQNPLASTELGSQISSEGPKEQNGGTTAPVWPNYNGTLFSLPGVQTAHICAAHYLIALGCIVKLNPVGSDFVDFVLMLVGLAYMASPKRPSAPTCREELNTFSAPRIPKHASCHPHCRSTTLKFGEGRVST